VSYRSTLAAAAALALTAVPAAAQRAKALPSTGSRIVASYEFRNSLADASFPRSVTVTDSAGTILARVDMGATASSIPMDVTVIETNLVLQGQTPDGVLTLVLDRQNEGGEIKLTKGTWTLGRNSGQLRGTAQP
jgi:hypothetical protein